MARRHFPTKRHGALPDLDAKITKGPQGNGWLVGDTSHPNLAEARVAAAASLGLQSQYPNIHAFTKLPEYKPAKGYKQPSRKKTKAVKATKVVARKQKTPATRAIAKTATTVPHEPLVQRQQRKSTVSSDPYDSANRIYIRTPEAEVSFPSDVSTKRMNATLQSIRMLRRKS